MCVQYWPASKDKDEEYGGIGVSVLKEEELANFHIRTIKLYKKNENDVSVFIIVAGNYFFDFLPSLLPPLALLHHRVVTRDVCITHLFSIRFQHFSLLRAVRNATNGRTYLLMR